MHYYDTFRRIVKTIFYVFVFLLIIFLISVLLFTFSGEEVQRRFLEHTIGAVTGGEVRLESPFHLELGRHLSLEAGGIHISDASRGPFTDYRSGKVMLRFPLGPLLLQRQLRFDFTQQGGMIRLRSGAGKSGTGVVTVVPERVTLRDVHLIWPRTGEGAATLRLTRLSLRRVPEEWGLDLKGVYGQQPLEVRTILEAGGERRRRMRIEGHFGRLAIQGEGWQGRQDPLLEIHLKAEAPDLQILAGAPFDSLPRLGPLKMEMDLFGGDTWRVENLVVKLGAGKRLRLKAHGGIADLFGGGGVEVAVEASSKDLPALARALDVAMPSAVVEADLSGRLAGDFRALRLRELEVRANGRNLKLHASGEAKGVDHFRFAGLRLEGAVVTMKRELKFSLDLGGTDGERQPLDLLLEGEGVKLHGQGVVALRRGKPELELEVSGKAETLKRLEPWTGLALQPVRPVELKGKVSYQEAKLVLRQVRLQVGASDLDGRLVLSSRSDAPFHVEGELVSRRWNRNEQLVHRRQVKPRLLESGQLPAEEAQSHLFSRQPFGLEWLSAVEGRVGLQVGELRDDWYRVEAFSSEVVISGGKLRMDAISGRLGGKPLKARFHLNGVASPPEASFAVEFREADLSTGFPGLGLPSDSGRVSLEVELRATGRSQAEMAASLEGEVKLLLERTPFGFAFPRAFERSLLEYFNPAALKEPGGRRLECGAVWVKLDQGVANLPHGLVMDFPQVTWIGNGVVDLGRETLYMALRPRTKRGFRLSLGGLADLVAVAGPLSSPYIVVNPKGALLTSLSYTAAVYTGGVSLLLEGILDELGRSKEPCARVLREPVKSKAGPREETPGTGSVLDALELQ